MTRRIWIGAVALGLGVGGGQAWAHEHGEKVSLEQLPQAARDTILRESGGATIEELEKEKKGDKVVYEAEFSKDGKQVEVYVDGDGRVVKREVEEKGTGTGQEKGTGEEKGTGQEQGTGQEKGPSPSPSPGQR